MHIRELREKTPAYLLELADKEGVENPASNDIQTKRLKILKKMV